jgi:peptidoglycan hydrolase CwlO-like protein
MKKIAVVLLIVFTATSAFFACGEKEQEKAETGPVLADKKAELKMEIQTRIDSIDATVDELDQELEKAGEDVDQDIRARREQLRELGDDLEEQLDKMKTVTADEWAEFKQGVDNIFYEINKVIEL